MRLQSPLQDGVQYARVRRGEFVMCGFGGCSAPRKYVITSSEINHGRIAQGCVWPL
ncbi:unnamed protein product [Tenebrio molitor]|nr:unnamed protein product [Tenebrio molitor]